MGLRTVLKRQGSFSYPYLGAIDVTYVHSETSRCPDNNPCRLTLQHTVLQVEIPLAHAYRSSRVTQWTLTACPHNPSVRQKTKRPVHSHRMPSIASCWINFMLDILTFAPVDSTNESPLPFFSITTSSGSPKPGVNKPIEIYFGFLKSHTQITCFTFYCDGIW